MQSNGPQNRACENSNPNFLDENSLEYKLPKVQAFDDILKKPYCHRPPEFRLYEKLGDTIWAFASYRYARDILPGEPEEKLKDVANYLNTADCHATISKYVGMEDNAGSMTRLLEETGYTNQESDYLECYLGMSYHLGSPETCMTAARQLVQVGLNHESHKKTATAPKSSLGSSSTGSGSASTSATTSPSPNPTPSSPLSKTQQRKTERLVSLLHQTAQHFIKFAYTHLVFQKLIDLNACQTVFTAFLHYFPEQMFKTVYPVITQDITNVKFTAEDKIRNENVVKLLEQKSPWGLAAEIHSCPEVQKSLESIDLVIANVTRLHDNDVKFNCEKGAVVWWITFKVNPLCKVKEFAKPDDLYNWLQSDQEVKELIDSRVVALVPTSENEAESGNDIGKQTSSRCGPRKRKDSQDNDLGKGDDGKGNAKEGRKRRRRQRRQKDKSDRK